MAEKSETLPVLQKRWDAACRIMFGEEVGKLEDFRPWLLELTEPMMHRKSSASGKDVTYAITNYCEGAKWIGFDEVDYQKKAQPLSINDIKDIDSLSSALSERLYYAGSGMLGNSKFVEKSANIADSFYMHETGKLTDCKYIAYSTLGRLSEDCFGCNGVGESQFCIKCYETYRDKRCFELWMGQNCSDCYYSHNIDSCQDALFCFNAKNLRHAIGNLALAPEKYSSIKKKLLAEMADGLRRNRALPSLIDIVKECGKPKKLRVNAPVLPQEAGNKAAIEEEFAKTCAIVLGRRLPGGIDEYAGWLRGSICKSEAKKSALSGSVVHQWDYCCYGKLPSDRLLTQEEARAVGQAMKIGEREAEGFSLSNAHERISGIAFFTPEYKDGVNVNLIDCPTSTDSSGCYRASPIVYSKYCAYSFWPRSTAHAFGCSALLSSEFCVRCYNSVKLSRCFEVDFSRDCSDSYFCHNAENCHDCLLCFNAKNLRYAIGNVEVGREEFLRVKARVMESVVTELVEKKAAKAGIFSIGCKP